jgi:hypothetical protein
MVRDVSVMSPTRVICVTVRDNRFVYGSPRIKVNIGLLAINAFVVEGEQWCFYSWHILKVTMRQRDGEIVFYKFNFCSL